MMTEYTNKEIVKLKRANIIKEGPIYEMQMKLEPEQYEVVKSCLYYKRPFSLEIPIFTGFEGEGEKITRDLRYAIKPVLQYKVKDSNKKEIATVWIKVGCVDNRTKNGVDFLAFGEVLGISDYEETNKMRRDFNNWVTITDEKRPVPKSERQLGRATKFNEWVKEFKNTKDGRVPVWIPMKKEAVNDPSCDSKEEV